MHMLAVAAMSLTLSGGVAAARRSRGDPRDRRKAAARAPAVPRLVARLLLAALRRHGSTGPRGRATLVFRLPQLDADVYLPAVRVNGDLVRGRGRVAVRAVPPPDLTSLGAPGCAPASPVVGDESFGTAVGAQLWALAIGPFEGVVGKPKKIVFRMTSGLPSVFYSIAPDGRKVAPVSGPTPRIGSNWNRPGLEFGSMWLFDVPGCWQIYAGLGPAQGDIWITVRS